MTADYNAYFSRLRIEYPKAAYPEPECTELARFLERDLTAQQCATEIIKYTNRCVPVNNKFCIYDLIIGLGRDFNDIQDDLVDLIGEIRKVHASKATGRINWSHETASFGEAWRTAYDSVWDQTFNANRLGGQNKAPARLDISRQWTNINTFDAKLEQTNLESDMANGLRLIVQTLEKKNISPAQLELHLRAAAAWLEFASKQMRSSADLFEEHSAWTEDSDFYKSGLIDSKRLAFWSTRLSELSSVPGLSSEVVQGCERATIALERAMWEKKK